MRANTPKTLTFLFTFVLLVLGSGPRVWVYAEELHDSAAENLDVVLLLDSSGSMLLTDPSRLRDEGAKLFLEFLKPGDRLGIVEFSATGHVVRPLSPFKREETGSIGAAISDIQTTGEYTNILAGLRTAAGLLEEDSEKSRQPVIVLLSDGKMEPPFADGSAISLTTEMLDSFLPSLKTKDIKVHTLAFSEKADESLLKDIAVVTGGANWFTPTAEGIHKSYADLFLVVKKPQIVPLTSKGFRIDPDIKEATFYINREDRPEIKISSPGGEVISADDAPDNIKWFRGKQFDVITIIKPEVGNWRVVGLPTNDGYATVLTDLRLVSSWPSNIHVDDRERLEVQLFEAKRPISLPEMTGVVKFAYEITPTDKVSEPIIREYLKDDGKNGDKEENDGVFSTWVKLDEEGEYKLRIVARGPTFVRNQQMSFRVKPRMVSISLVTAEAVEGGGHAPAAGGHSESKFGTKDYFRVELSPEVAALRKVELNLVAVDEEGRRYKLPIKKSKDSSLRYESPVSVLKGNGEFEVSASLSGEDKRKDHVRAASQILRYQKSNKKIDEKKHEEVVLEEEKPKEPPKEPSTLPYLILITIANCAAGVAALMLLKKSQQTLAFALPEFAPVSILEGAIAELKEKVSLTRVEPNDPIFKDLDSDEDESLEATVVAEAGESEGEASSEPTEDSQDQEGSPDDEESLGSDSDAAEAEQVEDIEESEGDLGSSEEDDLDEEVEKEE